MTCLIKTFKLRIGISILILSLVSSAQAQTSTVSGKIIVEGQPLATIQVLLKKIEGKLELNNKIVSSTTTDVEGKYQIRGIDPGSYRIFVYAPTFTISGDDYLSTDYGKTVSLVSGENIENLDFSLLRGGIITGKVSDDNNKSVVAQFVTAFRLDAQGRREANTEFETGRWRTDDRGIYRIYGLPPGSYIVGAGVASSEGLSPTNNKALYQRTYYPKATDETKAKIIEIRSGSEITNVDISLTRPVKSYAARGKIIDAASSKAVSGATISYSDKSLGGYIGGTPILSNSNGEFRIDGLSPNNYTAYVGNSGQSDSYSEPLNFEISNGDVSGLEIKIVQGGVISGVAIIEGAHDPSIQSQLTKIGLRAEGTTQEINSLMMMLMAGGSVGNINPDGTFRIGGIRPGMMRIMALFDPGAKGLSLARIEHNGAKINEINVESGAKITDVRLVFTYGTGVLEGRVQVKGEDLPTNIQMVVRVVPVEASFADFHLAHQANVDARGQFIIEGLSQGSYRVGLLINGDAPNLPKVEQFVIISDNARQEIKLILDPSKKGDIK